MKKISCLFISLLLITSLTSCAEKGNDFQIEETTNPVVTVNPVTETDTSAPETTTSAVTETTASVTITEALTQPQWTTAMIIDTYKKAASATHGTAKLQQTISLTDISVNNGDGAVNSVLKLIKPIISSVVSGSSSEINGITGGYTQLIESDLKSAEAYKKGNATIIKMIPKDQTDPTLVSDHHGTVGHLISVVGDISSVLGQMSDSGLPIEISNDNISAVYVSPSVNVKINENGIIENGTWRYTVTLTLSDFKVTGATVDNASVTMDNVITLNGGFSE